MREKHKRFLPKRVYNYIYRRVPRACVDIVIRDKRGVVLSRRAIKPNKRKWHLPGGRVFYGESLKKAIGRIARDEMGVRVIRTRLIGTNEYLNLKPFGHSVDVVYLVTSWSGKLRGSWQARDIRFFKRIPPNTETELRNFLRANRLIER